MSGVKKVKDLIKLVVYRCAEKGIEILIIPEETENGRRYTLPKTLKEELPFLQNLEESVSLKYQRQHKDSSGKAIAVEDDSPDLPSLRKVLKNDFEYAKVRIKEYIPTPESIEFINIKDAVKNMLPHEYELLKEVKEIVSDRNLLKNL